MVIGEIEQFLAADHARLDRLLAAADAEAAIDEASYDQFRRGLLRHIAMEERVLLPFAREKTGAPLPIAAQLRADHGQIAKLLVRSPTRRIIDDLRELLARHNASEEGRDGLYASCDAVAGAEAANVVARLREYPEVPAAKYYDGPLHRLP